MIVILERMIDTNRWFDDWDEMLEFRFASPELNRVRRACARLDLEERSGPAKLDYFSTARTEMLHELLDDLRSEVAASSTD